MHEPPAGAGPPPVAHERVPVHADDLAATVGELRSVRRWLLVTAAWAVAATAIAVIALLAANREDDRKLGARTASQVGQVQRQLNQRIDRLESSIADLAPGEALTSLDRRLRKVEQGAGKVSAGLDDTTAALDDLEARVKTLEETAAAPPEPTDTTPTETP